MVSEVNLNLSILLEVLREQKAVKIEWINQIFLCTGTRQ